MNPDMPPPGVSAPAEPSPPAPPAPPTPPPPPEPASSRPVVAVEIVSIAGLALTALALGAALWMYIHDGTQTPLVVGITSLIMKGGTIVDYWLGSSNSSQKKDSVIAGQLPAPPPPIPPTPPTPPAPPS